MWNALRGFHVAWSSSLEQLRQGSGMISSHFFSEFMSDFSFFAFSTFFQACFASTVVNFLRKKSIRIFGPGSSPCRNRCGLYGCTKSEWSASLVRDFPTYALCWSSIVGFLCHSKRSSKAASRVSPQYPCIVPPNSGANAKPIRLTLQSTQPLVLKINLDYKNNVSCHISKKCI